MPKSKPTPTYEHLTKEDRHGIAVGQVRQFEGELFSHELNLARLDAVPEDARDENHATAVQASEDAIATIQSAITVTKSKAGELEE